MRVVLGRQSLVTPGGTQTYAITVARELERLGHEVTLATEEIGPMAEFAREQGVRVVSVDELPSACDAILGHDLGMAARLGARYPEARLVYVVHSEGDTQMPPLIPGAVDAIVACSDRYAERARAMAIDAPIVRLREPISVDDFLYPTPLPERPRRALILTNYLRGPKRDMLVEAWESAGVECVQVGTPATPMLDPRPAIQQADIVVAKARAALEGMCCGRAVYIYDQFGGDGWVTPDSYPAIEADQLAGQASPRPRSRADLVADLGDYHPDMGLANHELVRTHHSARRHANALVEVLRGPHRRDPDRADTLAEVARLTRRTARAEARAAALVERAEAAEKLIAPWEERAAEAERQLEQARALLGTRRARAGLALGRVVDRLQRRG